MYGMIHSFFQKIFTDEYGPDKWEDIIARADIDMTGVIGMQQYPDELAYGIVGAAAEVTGRDAGELLRFLGTRWVRYTADGPYSHYYDSADSTHEFLARLDDVHADIGLIMPDLRPPSFSVTKDPDGSLTVRYHSERPGLEPFVEGLLIGLGDLYREPCSVDMSGEKNQSRDYAEFKVTFEGTQAGVK